MYAMTEAPQQRSGGGVFHPRARGSAHDTGDSATPGEGTMPLFDSAAVRDLLKPPPPGAHDWSVHEVGDPGSGRLVRHCSRCGVEQPYPADREAPPCAPRPSASVRLDPPAPDGNP